MTSDVSLGIDGPVATVSLCRPAKRNAISYSMWADLRAACIAADEHPEVRVVVLRGAGDHFCAGADITELLAGRDPHLPSFIEMNVAAEQALASISKPTIAFVQGDCIGGGCGLAIDCDLRIAVDGARFGITPSKLGVVYPPSSLERTVHLIGPAAKRLLFTGDLIDAAEARRIGLVDEVHAPDIAEARLAELCDTLASRSQLTQAATKSMIAAILEHGAVSTELAAQWAHEAALSSDNAEGVAAFVERRAPRFTWRPRRS